MIVKHVFFFYLLTASVAVLQLSIILPRLLDFPIFKLWLLMLEWARPLLETCSHSSAPQFPGSSSLFSRTNETDRKDWLVCLYCHFFSVFFPTVTLELVSPRIIPPWPPQHQRGRAGFELTEAELTHSQQPDICLRGFQTFSCFHLSEFHFCADDPAPVAQLSYESPPQKSEQSFCARNLTLEGLTLDYIPP